MLVKWPLLACIHVQVMFEISCSLEACLVRCIVCVCVDDGDGDQSDLSCSPTSSHSSSPDGHRVDITREVFT